jgi:hypothetical protein
MNSTQLQEKQDQKSTPAKNLHFMLFSNRLKTWPISGSVQNQFP